MANLNMHRVNDVLNGTVSQAKVGNNRDLRKELISTVFSLHGHDIVIQKDGRVIFDPCGYYTRTTAIAMQDAAPIFGLNVSVSFAKGRFVIRRGAVTYIPLPNGTIEIPQNDA